MQEQWQSIWREFKKSKVGFGALLFLTLLFLIAVYAPLLASSKPLVVLWNKQLYFPLFRYLFYKGFYSKAIDLFFNTLMVTLPFFLLFRRRAAFLLITVIHLSLFFFFLNGGIKDPSSNANLREAKREEIDAGKQYAKDAILAPINPYPSWTDELKFMTDYAKLNVLVSRRQKRSQHQRLASFNERFLHAYGREMETRWHVEQERLVEKKEHLQRTITSLKGSVERTQERLPELINAYRPHSHRFLQASYEVNQSKQALDVYKDHPFGPNYEKAKEREQRAQKELEEALVSGASSRKLLGEAKSLIQSYRDAISATDYIDQREKWIAQESEKMRIVLAPLLRPFHWEDDAGGSQLINQYVPWMERTRINRKDLVSSLIFGIRISLVVGICGVSIALLIGIPLGMLSGYFAGRLDLIICRIVEIWEAMPTFFMLLLIIAITQSKSMLLVILVLGIFGWTSFCRFIRAEVLRQRSLPYVLATKSLGFGHARIMFSHILPNAIPPILTLLPFSLMAAITSEAGLSFLGLGEEGSSSWGVLMDEGRSVFPGESYLLWPPAILLTLLLIAIALIGDVLRDALDPKLRS